VIVYASTKHQFQSDIMSNDIQEIIESAFKRATGRRTPQSELDSWRNSLQYMERVVADCEIPSDAGVSIEYHIPQSSKRIDFIISGKNSLLEDTAILVELKQWQEASLTEKDGVVETRFKHGLKETSHPSYQAWSYKCLLEDYNQIVQEEIIRLVPCAYLHNYKDDGIITNRFYERYLDYAPVFLKNDALKLREFIKSHVKYGDSDGLMYRIDHGKIRPSKNLAEQLASMLSGNEEFVLIDDQKVAYESALRLAQKSQDGPKQVYIIEGGPGTGKSVLAINLLVEMTKNNLVAQYITRNSAPREVYKAKLTGSFSRSRIDNMFSGSGSFHSVQRDTFDCLIVDEAHRLSSKSGMFSHLGENQIKEIIDASHASIFFVDEDQKVTVKDIGDKEEIMYWASQLGVEVSTINLESQFRCNGSDGYLAWLDNTLQIRQTANQSLSREEYDFRVFNSPAELHANITELNLIKNKARMLAGYCWKWVSSKNSDEADIVIDEYRAQWNLKAHGQSWIIHPDSVSEVGCIHTSQ
jgi:uncharacterized protein